MMLPNPRFPHTCTVYREGDGGDGFDEGNETTILYKGECRNYITTRNIGDGKVQSSQYTLAIPAYREVTTTVDNNNPGDDIEVPPLPKWDIVEVGGKKYERIIVRAMPGDKVICIDERGVEIKGTVVNSYPGTKGNNVFWNYDAN